MKIIDILSEAPLNDFDAFGDLDTPGSFRSDDLKAIRNPKWREKVFKAFSKTPFNFNVYVYNGEDGNVPFAMGSYKPVKVNDLSNISTFAGLQELRVVEKLIGKVPPDFETSITVLLVENEGGARLPLTPWILAHRICHAIQYAGDQHYSNYKIRTYIRLLHDISNDLLSEAQRKLNKSGINTDGNFNEVFSKIGTFRSARDGKLSGPSEFYVDAMVQYLVQGKVTFQRPDLGKSDGFDNSNGMMMQLAKIFSETNGRREFIRKAMNAEFGDKRRDLPPREPSVHYTAYKDGQPYASFGPDRVKQYEDRGYEIRKHEPSKKEINRWEHFKRNGAAREQELDDWYDTFAQRQFDNGHPYKTKTDLFGEFIEKYEVKFNETIEAIFKACVGKALVL